MKFSTFVHSCSAFLGLLLLSNLLVACKGNPSAEDYAQRLCDCYGAASEHALQFNAGKIDRPTYEQLTIECMGEDNPLKVLEDDPEAELQFKASFLDALKDTCPELARSMGYL